MPSRGFVALAGETSPGVGSSQKLSWKMGWPFLSDGTTGTARQITRSAQSPRAVVAVQAGPNSLVSKEPVVGDELTDIRELVERLTFIRS